jgi:transcriptional regulator with XRE-family HTH domain
MRRARGWSQSELAARAGINTDTVAAIERGRTTNPYPRTRDKIAAAFNVDASDLWPED